jgi:hypothetical protein
LGPVKTGLPSRLASASLKMRTNEQRSNEHWYWTSVRLILEHFEKQMKLAESNPRFRLYVP